MRVDHYLLEQGRGATGQLGDARVAGGSPASLRSTRGGSCGGVPGLADGAEERVAGALDGLGGIEVGGSGSEAVEGFEGDAGPEEVFGAGQGLEPLVGCGDILLPVGLPDAAAGAGDLGGEEAGPVEVEEGAEAALEKDVDPGDEGVGDMDVAEPPADNAAGLGLDERVVVRVAGPGLGEGGDVELVEQVGDLAVDVLASVVGVEGLDGEGEGGDKVLQHEDHEVLGDARHGAKVLELRDFVDDVDEVDALLAAPVSEVDGVDAQEPGLAIGLGLAADADGDGSRPGLAEGEAAGAVRAGLAEVVDVAVGDVGEPFEAHVAVDMAHAPEDHLGGGSGELAEGLVNLGQQRGVMRRVAALEGLAGGLLAVVADVTGPAVLLDEAGDLGAGEARHLLQVPLDLGLVRSPEAVVLEADQRAAHEGVGGSAVSELEVRGLVAFEEGAELVEGAYPFGAKCHDHPPMISSPRTSGSPLAGNRLPARAHLSLDKTWVAATTAIPYLSTI